MQPFPDRYTLFPRADPGQVEIDLPGSKSYTNRALLLAALAEGDSTLLNALDSDDTQRMVECLNQLGVPCRFESGSHTLFVEGKGGPQRIPEKDLYCGNAGTAIRFLAPFCALGRGPVTLTGNDRMKQRPIADLLGGLRQVGGEVIDVEGTGCPPIRVSGGGLRGGICRMAGDQSSQYFSSLLLSAAGMREGLVLEVEGDLVSKPYLDMTLDILSRFGVRTENRDYRTIRVAPGQQVRALEYEIEGDASGASYFFGAAAITRGCVAVGPLPADTKQGDRDLVLILERMGCSFRQAGARIELSGGPLRGVEVDLHGMSDVAQTLSVVALFAQGPTTIRNIANARIKETDRIAALKCELTKLGAEVEEYPDGLTIHPRPPYRPAEIETYDDHRMAMSFSLAALRIPGLVILNPGCVTKTFPDFFQRFAIWAETR